MNPVLFCVVRVLTIDTLTSPHMMKKKLCKATAALDKREWGKILFAINIPTGGSRNNTAGCMSILRVLLSVSIAIGNAAIKNMLVKYEYFLSIIVWKYSSG